MGSSSRNNSQLPSHDSFLDIVANMVGILIILVMVVGVRVKNTPVAAAISNPTKDAEVLEHNATSQSIREDIMAMADEIRLVERETEFQNRQRAIVAVVAKAMERELENQRDQLDARAKEHFDANRQLSQLQLKLTTLQRQRQQVVTADAAPTIVESLPTPLSEQVVGREGHFQLRGGYIAPIPLEQLIRELKSDAQRKKHKLLDTPEMVSTVGPINGFRLRYAFERRDTSPEEAMATGQYGSYAQLSRWTLIPISSRLGEPIDLALAEGSLFRSALKEFDPKRSTVTIWTYPDSFNAFRQLKKVIFQEGYSVAARPLTQDTPISGSPRGSKSAAQ